MAMIEILRTLILISLTFNNCHSNKINREFENTNDKLSFSAFQKCFRLHTFFENANCVFGASIDQLKSDLHTYNSIINKWIPLSYMRQNWNNGKILKEENHNVSRAIREIENDISLFANKVTNICKSVIVKLCYLKQYILRELDKRLASDQIYITDEILLVKHIHKKDSKSPREIETEPFWKDVTRRIAKLLETYTLQLRLGAIKDSVVQVSGRIGSHGYRHAFPMMVGSFMLLAAFMVPMGFQFLAVIGGKALILSQIALFMTMGGHLQRFLAWRGGFNGGGHPGNGFLQHQFLQHDDGYPWLREGSQMKADQGEISSHQLVPQKKNQLTQLQLQQYMS